MANGTAMLAVRGNCIVDGEGNPVVLRGFGLGGWMRYGWRQPGVWSPAAEYAVERQVEEVCVAAKAEGMSRAAPQASPECTPTAA